MTPPKSSGAAYDRLHPAVQRWIYRQGWLGLRPVQEDAIHAFYDGGRDLVIAAPTSGGKTEAAFLPICSAMKERPKLGIRALCISPLKALINDQKARLSLMGEQLDIPVYAWHGDISQGEKRRLWQKPEGLLLITPESMEALLIRHGSQLTQLFMNLDWLVIDELHVFITSERGRQIQSQMRRLEMLLKRHIRRLGLSATLGDLQLAGEVLRSGGQVQVLHSSGGGQLRAKITAILPPVNDEEEVTANVWVKLAASIFRTMRGSDNLVFANSRQKVELLTYELQQLSEARGVPQEFFAHYGNLSKELRQAVEAKLKKVNQPATAICTSTLELGIDIGSVHSIGQIGPPPSVSSLRQRLGRSGRREGEARLRFYYIHRALPSDAALIDRLFPGLFLSMAIFELLIEGWNEPLAGKSLHLSTLVHQILSLIAQYGGVFATDLWTILCGQQSAFPNLEKPELMQLLRQLGAHQLIQQMADGLLVLAPDGEKMVEHYSFYAVFATPEEFRVESAGRTLGHMPVENALHQQKTLLFGGKSWRIVDVDVRTKVIQVVPNPGGRLPFFAGSGLEYDAAVFKKMRTCYMRPGAAPNYLDRASAELFKQGQQLFRELGLAAKSLILAGNQLYVFPWLDSKVLNTLTLLAAEEGVRSYCSDPAWVVEGLGIAEMHALIERILSQRELQALDLVPHILNRKTQKFDRWLPDNLLDKELAHREIRLQSALAFLRKLRRETQRLLEDD